MAAIILLLIPLANDALDQLFKTAVVSLTTIINLLATWLVLFLLFAIASTQLFKLTRFGLTSSAPYEGDTTVYFASTTNSSAATAPLVTTNPTPPPS